MINENVNHSKENNYVKHGPTWKQKGENESLFFSLVSPVGLEETFSS